MTAEGGQQELARSWTTTAVPPNEDLSTTHRSASTTTYVARVTTLTMSASEDEVKPSEDDGDDDGGPRQRPSSKDDVAATRQWFIKNWVFPHYAPNLDDNARGDQDKGALRERLVGLIASGLEPMQTDPSVSSSNPRSSQSSQTISRPPTLCFCDDYGTARRQYWRSRSRARFPLHTRKQGDKNQSAGAEERFKNMRAVHDKHSSSHTARRRRSLLSIEVPSLTNFDISPPSPTTLVDSCDKDDDNGYNAMIRA
ncbi:hypothetical protein BDZ89DRAFT_1039240 [Hymenopellis radicata]|nr:hypothetical protein BDZ89DRAFT_1039240 [Hymenopellis radicata]